MARKNMASVCPCELRLCFIDEMALIDLGLQGSARDDAGQFPVFVAYGEQAFILVTVFKKRDLSVAYG